MTKSLPRTCHRWLSNPRSAMRNCSLFSCRCVIPGCCLAIPTPLTRVSRRTIPEESLTQSRRNLRLLKPMPA